MFYQIISSSRGEDIFKTLNLKAKEQQCVHLKFTFAKLGSPSQPIVTLLTAIEQPMKIDKIKITAAGQNYFNACHTDCANRKVPQTTP